MSKYTSEAGAITEAWSAGLALTARTVFQNGGATSPVRVLAVPTGDDAPTDLLDGIMLSGLDSITFGDGMTVYWRKHTGGAAILTSTQIEA
jgi:hypothetical protein